jgi:hypothetical protein
VKKLNCIGLISTALIVLLFQSCGGSKKIEIAKPEETRAQEQPFEIPSSFINVALTLTWNELAKQANALMPPQLMEDKEFNSDGLKVHLRKTGDVGISFLINQIQTTVPLSARVWYRYGAFGAYDVKEFRMQGTVYLLSLASIDEMAIKTRTRIDRIVWDQNPMLMFYGRNVPMGFVIDPILKSQSSNIASEIDKALKDLLDFKPLIMEELQAFRDPILISEDYKMWLQITPLSLVSSPLRMNNDKIHLDLSMNTKLRTTLGKKPARASKFDKIMFRSDTPIVRETQIKLPVETEYNELSELLTKNLKGTALYDGKKKVFMDSVQLWHSNKQLIIGVQTSGAVSGWVYLRGVPKFNPETSELYLDNLDYHVNTKNVLVKSLNWMLSGKILKLIQENSKYPLKNDLDDLKKELNQQLNGYSPMESVILRFRLQNFDFESVQLTNDAIITLFDIRALIRTEVG